MESERKAIRSVTHQVLARQISCFWHAPFSVHASAHPVTAGPENLQCPAGSTQSLKNIGSQTCVWSTLCLAGGRVESLQNSFSRQVERRNIRSNQSPGLNNPFLWLQIFRLNSVYIGCRFLCFLWLPPVLSSLLPAEDTAPQECNRSAVWSES